MAAAQRSDARIEQREPVLSLLASMTVVTALLLGEFGTLGSCVVYESQLYTDVSWFLYSVGYQSIFLALLSCFYETFLPVFHPAYRPNVRFPLAFASIAVTSYLVDWYMNTVAEFYLRINCAVSDTTGKFEIDDDDAFRIFLSLSIPQYASTVVLVWYLCRRYDVATRTDVPASSALPKRRRNRYRDERRRTEHDARGNPHRR
jgi:hypothetical protein